MKSFVHKCDRRTTAAIATLAATLLVASLLSSTAVNTAQAAKGGGVKAPAQGTSALTAQEQINRAGEVRPAQRPRDMSLDRKCKGPYRPRSCFPHRH